MIVIDDIDALCPRRDKSINEVEERVVATLLTLIDDLVNTNPEMNCLLSYLCHIYLHIHSFLHLISCEMTLMMNKT